MAMLNNQRVYLIFAKCGYGMECPQSLYGLSNVFLVLGSLSDLTLKKE